MPWTPHATARRSKTWRDTDNPAKRALTATLAALHYESTIDTGVYDTPVDFSINPVDNAQLDGWIVNQADYHYALGIDKLNHPGEDGWFAFGGRQGSHWLKFRLERVGYLRYTQLTWTGVGGLPTYTRSGNLSQQVQPLDLLDGAETINVGFQAEWRNLWATPGGGEGWLEFRGDGSRLKVNPVFNQGAIDYLATQYPGTAPQQNQYYLSIVLRVDHSDVPRAYKNGVLQSLSGDFDDDSGTASIEFRDDNTDEANPLGRLLALLPLDDLIIRDAATSEELQHLTLRKRFYQDGGNTLLLVGIRVDTLNAALNQYAQDVEIVFDPTIDTAVSATDDDAHQAQNGSAYTSTDVEIRLRSNAASNSRFIGGVLFTVTGISSGDTVDVAYNTIRCVNTNRDDPNVDIYCNDVDSAADFTTDAAVTTRALTTASVAWVTTALGVGSDVNSPSLVGPIQEVIDRTGWSSGNALMVIYKARADFDSQFGFHSYDGSTTLCARLHLEYTAGGGPVEQAAGGTLSLAGAITRQPQTTKTGSATLSGQPFLTPAKSGTGTILTVGNVIKEAGKSASGTLSVSGTLANTVDKLVSGTLTLAGTVQRAISRTLSATLSLSGQPFKTPNLSGGGTITTAGNVIKQAGVSITGTLTLAGAITQRSVGKLVSGVLSLSAAITRLPDILTGGTITFDGTPLKQVGRTVNGSLSFAGSLTQSLSLILTGTLTLSGQIIRQPGKVLVGTLTLVGTITQRNIAKILTGVLSFIGTLSSESSGFIQQAVGGVLAFSGQISQFDVGKGVTGTIGLIGAITRQIGQNPGGSVAFVAEILRQPGKTLTGGIASAGSLSNVANKLTTGVLTTAGSITNRALTRTVQSTLTLAGAVTKQISRTLAGLLSMAGAGSGTVGGTFTQAVSGVLSFTGTLYANVLSTIQAFVFGPDSLGEVDGPESTAGVDGPNSLTEADDQ